MRIVFPMLTAVLLLGGSARAGEDAVAVVRKAIKAHGGEANLDKLKMCMIRSEGSVDIFPVLLRDIEYTFKAELIAKPGRFKASIKYFQVISGVSQPYLSVHTLFDGDGHIVRDGRSEFLREQGRREFKTVAHQREVCLLTPLLKDRKFKLTVLDRKADVSGRAAVAVMVYHEDHQDIVLYFDKENGRLVKSKRNFFDFSHSKDGELVNIYSDFRTVYGAVLAHRIVTFHDGKQASAERITSVVVLETAPDEWFRIKE